LACALHLFLTPTYYLFTLNHGIHSSTISLLVCLATCTRTSTRTHTNHHASTHAKETRKTQTHVSCRATPKLRHYHKAPTTAATTTAAAHAVVVPHHQVVAVLAAELGDGVGSSPHKGTPWATAAEGSA